MKKEVIKNEEFFAKKLALVGDAVRLRIICLLFSNGKLCVSEVAEALDIPIANVSHHLRTLAGADILQSFKEGKTVCYTLSDDQFALELKNFICKFKSL